MYMKNYYTQVLNLSSNAILYLFIFASMSLKGLSPSLIVKATTNDLTHPLTHSLTHSFSPERVRCGIDIVLHPGFSLTGSSRPMLMRQQSKMTKVAIITWHTHTLCYTHVMK